MHSDWDAWSQGRRPHVFGMTASPLDQKSSDMERTRAFFDELERNLAAKVSAFHSDSAVIRLQEGLLAVVFTHNVCMAAEAYPFGLRCRRCGFLGGCLPA